MKTKLNRKQARKAAQRLLENMLGQDSWTKEMLRDLENLRQSEWVAFGDNLLRRVKQVAA